MTSQMRSNPQMGLVWIAVVQFESRDHNIRLVRKGAMRESRCSLLGQSDEVVSICRWVQRQPLPQLVLNRRATVIRDPDELGSSYGIRREVDRRGELICTYRPPCESREHPGRSGGMVGSRQRCAAVSSKTLARNRSRVDALRPLGQPLRRPRATVVAATDRLLIEMVSGRGVPCLARTPANETSRRASRDDVPSPDNVPTALRTLPSAIEITCRCNSRECVQCVHDQEHFTAVSKC